MITLKTIDLFCLFANIMVVLASTAYSAKVIAAPSHYLSKAYSIFALLCNFLFVLLIVADYSYGQMVKGVASAVMYSVYQLSNNVINLFGVVVFNRFHWEKCKHGCNIE